MPAKTITLDDTALLMLKMVRQEEATEPVLYGYEDAPRGQVEESARRHDRWERELEAARLILAARLLSLVLDD